MQNILVDLSIVTLPIYFTPCYINAMVRALWQKYFERRDNNKWFEEYIQNRQNFRE